MLIKYLYDLRQHQTNISNIVVALKGHFFPQRPQMPGLCIMFMFIVMCLQSFNVYHLHRQVTECSSLFEPCGVITVTESDTPIVFKIMYSDLHTHTHTHTHAHTHTHKCVMQTLTHTHSHTHTHTHTHTQVCHANNHSLKHTHTHTHTHVYCTEAHIQY